MEILGTIHCLFEQSGVFKNEFIRLGYAAFDYDIRDEYGETDIKTDLFTAIHDAYDGRNSIFDTFSSDDLIIAFFPCTFFCQASQSAFIYSYNNYSALNLREKTEKILIRSTNREYFYQILIKLFYVVQSRGLRMIVENPFTGPNYLLFPQNFVLPPTLIDYNRQLRGDFFKKPTAYWFLGCEPTFGCSLQEPKKKKSVLHSRDSGKSGMCSSERSMMSPDYARNFICDFILGRVQKHTQMSLFNDL